MDKLIKMISDSVKFTENPAVYISGGIDSTIILHHVAEKSKGPVHTYTSNFGVGENDCEVARQVAEHYGTIHKEIKIDNLVDRMPKILQMFDRPRYNFWIYYLAEAVKNDGLNIVFGGEGADEHFGGYPDRTYLGGWSSHISYILPTYNYIHNHFEIEVMFPFDELDWIETYPYFTKGKQLLRDSYKNIIPDVALYREKKPPVFKQYWEKELKRLYPNYQGDPYLALQLIVAKIWVQVKGDILNG